MSKPLAQLLGMPEPAIAAVVHQLEELSGYPSDDVRLIVDIEAAQRERTRSLGLDPEDTTSQELYHSLLARFESDEKHFKAKLDSLGSNKSPKLPRLISLIDQQKLPTDVWVLKKSSAKAVLKSNPPKALMKKIGCRSVESMLKNRNVSELFAGLSTHQSPSWFKQFDARLSKLNSMDFEVRKVELIALSPTKWEALLGSKQKSPILAVPALGALLINTGITSKRGTVLGSAALIIQSINGLRTRSVVLKLKQMNPDFSRRLPQLLFNPLGKPASLGGQGLCWRTIIQACSAANSYPELFEPHVLPDDLQLISVEAALANIVPELAFWIGSPAVGYATSSKAISHNMLDVAANFQSQRSYARRLSGSLQRCLWDELIDRYFVHPGVQRVVFSQLEDDQPKQGYFSDNVSVEPVPRPKDKTRRITVQVLDT